MNRSLGEFEQALLFALVALGDGATGSAVGEWIERTTGRSRSPGAIHTALERLGARGFVTSELGDPTPVRGGRRRRHYGLTKDGARALKASHDTLTGLADGRLTELAQLAE